MTSELCLVVGAARSGTTLTRLLLDAHPEVACPAEAGLPGLMAHMRSVWATVDAEVSSEVPAEDPGLQGPAVLTAAEPVEAVRTRIIGNDERQWIAASAKTVMARYCNRHGKRIYVDKSLDSVYNLGIVEDVFPGTRSVLVFRHVMDTIASGIEASPWGFNAYGYGRFVAASPGNTVMALANYWITHVDAALAWERDHPQLCLRVRYEDLVTSPEPVVERMQSFLGVQPDLTVLNRAFQRAPSKGPGDYKVEYTSAVHSASVGRGKRIPVGLLPTPLLEALNVKLSELGYGPLDGSWNTEERSTSTAAEPARIAELAGLMQCADIPQDDRVGTFAVVAEDDGGSRWIVDPGSATLKPGDGDVDGVVTGTVEDLVLLVRNGENAGALLRAGRIRFLLGEEPTSAADTVAEFGSMVRLLQDGVSRTSV